MLLQATVFLSQGTISSFRVPTEKYPRFALWDAFLTRKIRNQILFIHKTSSVDNDDDDGEEHDDEKKDIRLCDRCFQEHQNWLSEPLSTSKFDRVKEWQVYAPLPVWLFLQKAFVSEDSLRRSQDPGSLAASKVARLLAIYDSSLNTLNKLHFGVTQEMNTAELVVSYHNATRVFNITQSAGITRSLNSVEITRDVRNELLISIWRLQISS